jgi:glycosyltransferase involved in cell wall biosynthesis
MHTKAISTCRFSVVSEDAGPTQGPACGEPSLRRISVLMPIYNERWTLATIVKRVLATPFPLDLELVAVDDCSQDGSWEVLQQLAAEDPRIRPIRHERNQGKGTAIRTAIQAMTGDVAVIQDADMEYDPHELPLLLQPILDDKADAVFGSRFTPPPRRVLCFWHSVGNQALTLLSNMFNDLNLTDMETCYKMVRSDVLRSIRLTSNTFTLEPEITCRLAQWGARIYEVPISYSGRTYQEGKKIGFRDAVKALWTMVHRRYIDTRFTHHSGLYALTSMARANRYNRWLLAQVKPYLGERLLQAGSGTGNLSSMLVDRQRLVLVEQERTYIDFLRRRFDHRDNVRVDCGDLTREDHCARWQDEELDTVLCCNVLEHIEDDEAVLGRSYRLLTPGGHCVVVAPAGPWLYTSIDEGASRCRRYAIDALREKMSNAGFDIVHARRFGRLGALGWAVSGHLLKRREFSPRQRVWFDRLFPLARLMEYVLPMPGLSLIMVGRKRPRAARLAAA